MKQIILEPRGGYRTSLLSTCQIKTMNLFTKPWTWYDYSGEKRQIYKTVKMVRLQRRKTSKLILNFKISAGQINRTRKSENSNRTRSDKNESEPIRIRCKYRVDLVLWYFGLWVLSEPNPNLNGYPKYSKSQKRICTEYDSVSNMYPKYTKILLNI